MSTWDEALVRLQRLNAELEAAAQRDSLAKCGCGRLRWASTEKCPACVRGPLPSDEELRRRFDASPKLRHERDGEVRHLDPRTVVATPPRQIRKKTPATTTASRPSVRTGGTGSPSPRRSNGR